MLILSGNTDSKHLVQVRQNVQKLARSKNEVENRIREYRQRIVELRQSKAKEEMKAKKIQNDTANLEEEFSKVLALAEETKRKLEPVKVFTIVSQPGIRVTLGFPGRPLGVKRDLEEHFAVSNFI